MLFSADKVIELVVNIEDCCCDYRLSYRPTLDDLSGIDVAVSPLASRTVALESIQPHFPPA